MFSVPCMGRTCRHCSAVFELLPKEQELYKTLDVPDPVECPACRRQRRLMFRNFFHLYHRTCDLTGKKILSVYDEGTAFPVYGLQEWWSDKWDGLDYGIAPDFSRSFFEQVAVLHRTVPRIAFMNVNCENCDYCNMSNGSRNCYLVFGNVGNEDCMYGHIVWQSKDCYDCLYTYRSEYCYECIDCVQCHSLSFSRTCDNCSSSMFLVHCVGCHDCFGCVGLKNKEFHIFNVPHSKEDYRKKIAELNTGNIRTIALAKKKVNTLIGKEIVKNYHGFNCENVTGDYLYNCRNIYDGYDLKNCEDTLYSATLDSFSDSLDCNFCGINAGARAELCYNCLTIGPNHRLIACHACQNDNANLFYCDTCHGCQDCFGCVSLKQKRYCILNKQYTKEEYETLLSKLIAHMKKHKEWGQFFPREMSPFAYNETIAQEYFPLTKEQAIAHGWRWKEEEEEVEERQENYLGPQVPVPDDIRDADDSICERILRCAVTGKLFKIIPQELQFYRDMKLPLPRKCFVQRQRERFALRNPRQLFKRTCAKCKKPIETTYAPNRPEIVYCEECYLKEVY
ncbi:MAG: hypothetical protein PHO20_06215 [Candidatus Peribacteraceae bacterium]|nr:hypothetical protein [Candidatus Peribacteraceae bacterium]